MPQDNRSAMRKTIVARIATIDTSIPSPTDSVPDTLFGYPVVGPGALPEKMRAYFKNNPQAAGHYEMNGGE